MTKRAWLVAAYVMQNLALIANLVKTYKRNDEAVERPIQEQTRRTEEVLRFSLKESLMMRDGLNFYV